MISRQPLKLTLAVFVLLTLHFTLSGQNQKKELHVQEQIYLHTNASFLLTGESVLFKVYCINLQNQTLSSMSSVAYVELIDELGVPQSRTKVGLRNGLGAGDMFLSSSLSTGHYTLIAYTRWMKNFSNRNFYRTQITIVNPFKKQLQDGQHEHSNPNSRPLNQVASSAVLTVSPEKKVYKTREAVHPKLTLSNFSGIGHLSIGVRRVDNLPASSSPSVGTAPTDDEQTISHHLPDLRGPMITGIVRNKGDSTPAAGKIITMSVPKKSYLFFASKTDSSGRFYFNADELKSDQFIILKMQDCKEQCVIQPESDFLESYVDFIPSKLNMDPSLKQYIEEQSIRSQVENAYFQVKRDSLLAEKTDRFFGKPDHTYALDKYVRFQTMEDVLREYVAEVYVRKRGQAFTLKAMNGKTGVAFKEDPLILLDGVPIFDHDDIMKYDPLKVEKIEIVTHKYFFGPLVAYGIISFETYHGEAPGLSLADGVKQLYTGIQPQKIYYSPDYSKVESGLSRIPDYRTQLCWVQDIEVNSKDPLTLEFHTSDITGTFEVKVEGFLSSGEFVHAESSFQVN